jgi:hypothetical protein
MQTDHPTPAIHQEAQKLVVTGHLPAPYIVSNFDGRPLWDVVGIAEMLDTRPDQLIDLLLERGPAHLQGDRGIPSSWRMLVEG